MTQDRLTPAPTPGPWKISPDCETLVVAENGRPICSTGGVAEGVDPAASNEENRANAQVIASAPDLVRYAWIAQALDRIFEDVDTLCDVQMTASQAQEIVHRLHSDLRRIKLEGQR